MENQDIIRLLKSVHEPDMDDDELSDAMNAMMDSIAETLGRFFGATSYDPGAAYTQFGRVMADALTTCPRSLEQRTEEHPECRVEFSRSATVTNPATATG